MTADSWSMAFVQRILEHAFGGDARFQRIAEWELRWMGLFVVGLVVYLLWVTTNKRTGKRKPKESRLEGSTSRRTPPLWLGVVPLLMGLLVVDAWAYSDRLVAPLDAIVVNALARDNGWEFTYPNGKLSNHALAVPRGRPVRLILTALRGIRSLRMVEPRVNTTAIAGRFTTTWFKPERLGEFPIANADAFDRKDRIRPENLAANNTVHVMSSEQFDAWLSAPSVAQAPVAQHR